MKVIKITGVDIDAVDSYTGIAASGPRLATSGDSAGRAFEFNSQ